jgi:hypothetical protein
MLENDPKWESLSKKVFHAKPVKAPPYLWTRVLAAIEEREAELLEWWTQWRWMTRLTMALAFGVALFAGSVYLETAQGTPTEAMLQGARPAELTGEFAQSAQDPEIVTAYLVEGGSSWDLN